MGTPEQLKLFSGMMDTFAGNGISQTYKGADGIQKAAAYVALHEVDLTQKLGKPLYDRMLAQLKSADTITGQPTQSKTESAPELTDSDVMNAIYGSLQGKSTQKEAQNWLDTNKSKMTTPQQRNAQAWINQTFGSIGTDSGLNLNGG
jgi:bisphosphoglycerate-dependent phosphoglycerate mutase